MKQIRALTATRAVAAFMVVVHHFGYNIFPFKYASSFFRNGNLAVSYFFVLSGFVLYAAYHKKPTSYGNFLKKRAIRILPVYFLALALSIAIMVAPAAMAGTPLEIKQGWSILLSGTLLQGYVPDYATALNGPGWSLSVEMTFYLLFPSLLLLQQRHPKLFLWLSVALFVATQTVHVAYYYQYYIAGKSEPEFILFNPVFHLNQFMIGMLGGVFFAHSTKEKAQIRWLPLLFLVLIVALVALRPAAISYHAGLIAPLFLLLIVSTAICDPKLLQAKWLVRLGEASYGLYILQEPVHRLTAHMQVRVHMGDTLYFYAYLALLITLALLSYHFVELPVRKRFIKNA
jgi:peptidoglycan/LPS O-acetylase OafA/YrhL